MDRFGDRKGPIGNLCPFGIRDWSRLKGRHQANDRHPSCEECRYWSAVKLSYILVYGVKDGFQLIDDDPVIGGGTDLHGATALFETPEDFQFEVMAVLLETAIVAEEQVLI